MKTRMKKTVIGIMAVVLLMIVESAFALGETFANEPEDLFPALPAQDVTDAFAQDGYELEQMLIVSRHNIRSPLSDKNSVLGQVTPHEWFDWTSEAGELSVKGGQMETAMGQFFRKYLVNRGFMPENWIPEDGEVRFYANSFQRTLTTARYFASGMLPVADVEIEHHMEYGEMDPFFCVVISDYSPEFDAQVHQEIDAMCGEGGLAGAAKRMEESFALVEELLNFKD